MFGLGYLLESLLSFGCLFELISWDVLGAWLVRYIWVWTIGSFWVFFLGVWFWVGQISIKGIKALYCVCAFSWLVLGLVIGLGF